jgi:hypothetical protein
MESNRTFIRILPYCFDAIPQAQVDGTERSESAQLYPSWWPKFRPDLAPLKL